MRAPFGLRSAIPFGLVIVSASLLAREACAQLLPTLPAGPAPTAAGGKKLDLTYVPADAAAAIVIQPRRALTNPAFPPQLLALIDKNQVGFDVRDIEQVMAVGPFPAGQKEGNIAAVLKFAKPIDTSAMASAWVPRGRDGQIDGKHARIGAMGADSCVVIDDRTMLVGNQAALHWALAARPAEGPLRKLMAAADDSPEVQFIIAVEPLRATWIEEAKQVPPQLAAVARLPRLLDSIVASIKLTPKGGMQLQITATSPNEQAAQQAETDIKQLLETGKSAFLAQVKGATSANPPPIDFGSMANNVASGLQPTHNRNRVEIRVDAQSGAATMGVATALLLPAVQAARETAARNSDANNLHTIGIGLMLYEDKNRRFPAAAICDKDGKPLLSWRVQILPYIDEDALYKEFHLDEPWDSENNKKLLDKMPAVFKHPKFDKPGMTLYQGVVGKGFAFDGKEGTKIASFTDGLSKTILVVEATPDKAVPWTKPDDWQPGGADPTAGLGGLFAGNIFNVLFGDTHAEGIAKPIDPNLFKGLLTRNGHEPIPAQ
jgi:hypothetical protein